MVMIPAEYDITVVRGGTFELPISINNGSGLIDFSATYTGARMHVRKAFLGPPVTGVTPVAPILIFLTTGISPKLVFTGTTLYIRMTAAETAAIPVASGVYDLELYSGSGASETVDKCLYGKFTVGREVTI